MKWPKNQKQTKLKIVFKSGFTHDLWVKELSVTAEKTLEWEHVDEDNQFLEFAPDDISAIIQIGERNKTVWE
mgnify:CR=1 FL=1|tara:strand:+ start:8790 stop:9005 length:216 start_codon:yes stop_codon:yes gene_type:complete